MEVIFLGVEDALVESREVERDAVGDLVCVGSIDGSVVDDRILDAEEEGEESTATGRTTRTSPLPPSKSKAAPESGSPGAARRFAATRISWIEGLQVDVPSQAILHSGEQSG